MRKDDVCSWRSTSWQTFMRRKWCTMPLHTYRKYTSPKSLVSVAIANKENAKSPSDHSTPMTATRHGLQMSYRRNLNDQGVDHRCLLYYESINPHCAICMASYCEMKYRKKLSEGTVWRARVTWSKGTLTWDWSFTDLTSVQNRSMCSAVKYSQGQLLRDVWGWARHKKEKKRKSWGMKWCAWWAESQWCTRKDTACV